MLRKFGKEDVVTQNQMKSSALRGVKQAVCAAYPGLAPYIGDILPKKQPVLSVKCREHVTLIAVGGDVLFFSCGGGGGDSCWVPTLRLLHRYPTALPQCQVDRGAIRFLLSGAQVMCPGLTSPGGALPDAGLPVGSVVAVMAEGKQHAVAIARTLMSSQQIAETNKGPALDSIHYLGDGLWRLVL